MDRFLLNNVAQYQALVKALGPAPETQIAQVVTRKTNPDMVVSARIRPLLSHDVAAGFPCAVFPRSAQAGVVDLHDLYNHPRGRPILKSFNYEVDKLFDSQTTTEEIYETLVADLVPLAWNGGIGTLFTYGQTGSGKTFTVSRLEQLVAKSLMDGSREGQRHIYITIIDLAGSSAYDLLDSRQPISILEDSSGVTQLAGAKEYLVRDRDDVMNLIKRATSFRRTAPTLKNDASSRSHGICRIRVENPSTDSEGLLYLVDLAGSEAARDVAVHGADRMRETREINMSLSVLKDCIRGKAQADLLKFSSGPKSRSKKPHLPFRQSVLTRVLKHVFDPASNRDCKTVVIACINPSLADVGPSKNTLRYAEMLRVLVPTTKKTEPSSTTPTELTNAQLQDSTVNNPDTPPVLSDVIDPTESGQHFLRRQTAELESRGLQNPGVHMEQAKGFQSRGWQVQIDSQRFGDTTKTSASNPRKLTKPDNMSGGLEIRSRFSSRDSGPIDMTLPFKERIRPGMAVSWKQLSSHDLSLSTPDESKLAVVLCPVQEVPEAAVNVPGKVANHVDNDRSSPKDKGADSRARYLCAMVTPGRMAEAYELHLWRQIVIDVGMMDKEVYLEYDTGTRYYYISV